MHILSVGKPKVHSGIMNILKKTLDKRKKELYIKAQLHTSLIKSGGGNGPMKPGNLQCKVPNPAARRKMRIR